MTSPPKRRWFAFRLRTLLVVVVVVAVALLPVVWKIRKAHRQQKTVEAIKQMGGSILYAYQTEEPPKPPGPQWLRSVVGDEYFQKVIGVALIGPMTSEHGLVILHGDPIDLPRLSDLRDLREVNLQWRQIRDLSSLADCSELEHLNLTRAVICDLSPLSRCVNLKTLELRDTRVADTLVNELAPENDGKYLHQTGTQVTDEEVARLQKALPNCKIIR